LIYIKEDDKYLKYHTGIDTRLICTKDDGTETVILNDISGEFDAVCDKFGTVHFVLQGIEGDLIYLKKENNTWKKYNIFKSRKGLKKIHGLCLKISGEKLCAFYIMEHEANLLVVEHRFSLDNLYEEPEVLGIADARRDFCVCSLQTGDFYLFYKDENGFRRKAILDCNFNLKAMENTNLEGDILSLRCMEFKGKIYAVYTVPRKSSTALVFCDINESGSEKIITFGISRNCIAQIVCSDNTIYVQWQENLGIMQSELKDGNPSFKKSVSLGNACVTAKVRNAQTDGIKCDMCAVYNFRPYIGKEFWGNKKNMSKEAGEIYMKSKNDITNPFDCNDIIEKLNSIQSDINNMGKTLLEMCEFLNELKKFKDDTVEDNFGFVNIIKEKKESLSGEDIGQIDEGNIKLFESTDIDAVLPERKEGV